MSGSIQTFAPTQRPAPCYPPPHLMRRQHAPRPPARYGNFLLDLADPMPGSRVVLLGHGELELGCELIRAGIDSVTLYRLGCPGGLHDRSADIVIMAHAGTAALVDAAVATAARLLCPLGTLILGGVPHALRDHAATLLRQHGLSRLRVWTQPAGAAMQAELPLQGGVPCV